MKLNRRRPDFNWRSADGWILINSHRRRGSRPICGFVAVHCRQSYRSAGAVCSPPPRHHLGSADADAADTLQCVSSKINVNRSAACSYSRCVIYCHCSPRMQPRRLRCYRHVLRKEDDDWVKKCMEYEVEGPRPKRTWKEVVREDCQARKMNKVDAKYRCKWRKMIKDVRWSGWVWVWSGTGLPGLSRTKGR